ncbi:MAG: hypothetical protein K2I21_05305 [Acetatifactor sp.]|nr:hypothetical protein [Acetatifactor sp.]
MTKAYEDYHKTAMQELAALTELFSDMLHSSLTSEEINQQADRHFANMDHAAAKYWEAQT